MKLKLVIIFLTISHKFHLTNPADLFDDQPKILVSDGNLVFESADSRNISIRLKGDSRFLVNNIDVLKVLKAGDASYPTDPTDFSDALSKLTEQVSKLRQSLRGQNGILKRLDHVELGIPANATLPTGGSDRNRINGLQRRVSALEMKVANLTERLMQDHCKSYPCQNGGSCFNMFETYRCECPSNYEGPNCNVDVNECARFAGTDLGCQNGATCINIPGSYQCACTEQWKGQNCNRQTVDCLKVPPSEICGHGTCIQVGSKLGYSCICEQGWRKANDTQACTVDVDECNEMRPHCSTSPKVICINTPGSFVCGPCPAGFSGNGYSCSDINECEINNGGCSVSPKVLCINTRGSSRCSNCPLGYDGDGKTCMPSSIRPNLQCVDSSVCNENALCTQYPNSSPTCVCRLGFTGNGIGPGGCTLSSFDPCSALACKNGGFCVKNGTFVYCQCPRGTSPPLCEISDSCKSNPCLNGGNCTNSQRLGGKRYYCSCLKSFSGSNCENQVSRCGGVRSELNGTLSYPEDMKAPYMHNSRCSWLIRTNHTKVLNVTFTKFDLEAMNKGECRFDFLQIHDGRTSASSIIGRFCGQTLPKGGNIITTHNMLYLWFKSDNNTAHDGFELSWNSIDPVCGGEMNISSHGTISSPGSPGNYPMNRDCEWFITAPPGKRIQFLFYTLMIETHPTCGYDYVEIHSGLGSETTSLEKYCNTTNPPPMLTPSHTATIHFHSDGTDSDAGFQIAFSVVEGIPGCGGTYTSPRGDVMSPTNIADGKYKHNMICDYVIQLPTDSRVRLEFKKFALEDSSACKFDKVEIFEGSVFNEETLIGRYCGQNKPPIITSQTNIVTVKFTTDWSSNDEGFQFQYQLLCGGIYTAETGVILSPNYPNPYAGERTCEYDISAPQGKVIVLSIQDLDVEKHTACEFDNLEIFDGFEADNATSLGRFCGDTKPGIFTSSFNHLHVHFSSDASVNGKGFMGNYSFVDVECGGIIKDSSELIKSPMETDGNGVYKSNAFCQWLVFAPKGFVIQMNFINFELELDTTCKYDFVKIFNNGSGKGEAVGPFCGTAAPKVITTVDNIATILFQSDASSAKDGFTISLVFIEGSKLCGGNYMLSQGIIRSPGKPEYLPNKECEWVVTVPNGQQIELNFNLFEMEAHASCRFDGLEIRNGGNSFAPLIGKFCGKEVPAPIKSFGNQLYFKFSSDSSRGGAGFEIEWDGTSTGCGGIISTTKGSISSPNYPKSYANNAQCEWRISVNEGSTIEIIFTDLDMETQAECKYDYLEIFDGPDASSNSVGKFCSSENHPMHLVTGGNHAMIRMNTDDSHSGRGFFLKYSINCNRTIYLDSGVIESPNFPNDYPNSMDCTWTIVVSKGNKINLQFSHFNFENDNQFHNETNEHICKYDHLEIYDLDFESKSEKGQKMKYCNSAPENRITSTDAVVVIFHSDASATSNGFRLEWFIEGCGGLLTHPEGTLLSPNFPNRYNHDLICNWEINVEYGHIIEVAINELDIEQNKDCKFDSLAFSNDQNFTGSIMKICESQHITKVVTSNGHKLYVKFTSDDSNNGKGFNMTYRSSLATCGGKFFGSKGNFSTKDYPTHNYENNQICEWNLKTDPTHSITFQFLDFDLESSENCTKDVVEIFDPIFNKLLWSGCGSQMPNLSVILSNRNELNIMLRTDDSINAKGFKANFSDTCGSRIVTNSTGSLSFHRTLDDYACTWTIISGDPSKKVTITFIYSKIFKTEDGCSSVIFVYDGDSDQGSLKKSFCGSKNPPSITSSGNALTVKLNTTSASFASEFDIEYSVLDNACGAIYTGSIQGEFGSPNYPDSSPLNSNCEWKISATAGNKMSLTIKNINIPTSPNCNENYLEIRKQDRNGPLIGVYCGTEIPANLESSQSFWIKYKSDGSSASNGFLADYNYLTHSDLEGSSGFIESPNYPRFFTTETEKTYRIIVQQGSVILIEFPDFFMDEEEDDCYAFLKVYNGFDDNAPVLKDELCGESPESLTTETNTVFLSFNNQFQSKTKFKISWKEIDKEKNYTGVISECGDQVVSMNNISTTTNFTSPGYPYGYDQAQTCTWTIMSGVPGFHPHVYFNDVDLEDTTDCYSDYILVSTDRSDGSWKDVEKVCSADMRHTRRYEGTPNLKLKFVSDYGTNGTGFLATTYLDCGGIMTESEGIIEYNVTQNILPYRTMNNCRWNITVGRGKTIQFEFLNLNIANISNGGCGTSLVIRNGVDDLSPYLGQGQFCGKSLPKDLPATSSNRAFVKYKTVIPVFGSFKLRYYEIQHKCGGQIRLSLNSNFSKIISSPNYPNIPPPHIECKWTIIAPIGENIRIDFIDRFDLLNSKTCDKEYLELRDGSTSSSQLIGTFCGEKPTTKYSKSNILMMKFFTDIADPRNGFKVNASIGICGGLRRSNLGYLTSSRYPGIGAYPSNAECEYRIIGTSNTVFNVTFLDIDLPELNQTACDLTKDHIQIFSIISDFNLTNGEMKINEGVFCGQQSLNASVLSASNEILILFKTFGKSKNLFRGFKILYNATSTSCGGKIDGESGVITSPGYPSKTLKKNFCEWRITVPKGRRVKIEFDDVDFMRAKSQLIQRVAVYNDFRYSNRLKYIQNNTIPETLYSSDNRMMVAMWVRLASANRGFKLKFSSEDSTICTGNLNAETGKLSPPSLLNLTTYSCDYIRESKPILPLTPNVGTIAYYFTDLSIGRKVANCKYASTVVNVRRRSGSDQDEMLLANICGNETAQKTVLSPFADVSIEVKQGAYFGPVNFNLTYQTHKCGGLLLSGGENAIVNPGKDASNQKILDCAWFAKYSEGFSVAVSVKNLSLKLSCEHEYIKIFNGPTSLSPSIGKYCGQEFSRETIVSESNTVYIEYHTDNFIENSKDSMFEIKLESASFGCGGVLNKKNYKFKTPLYSQLYPANTECIWEIRGDPGYHIGLAFYDRFYIEESPNCTKDYVEVFDFVDNDWKSLGKNCGRQTPTNFNSTSDKMKIIFRSDDSINADGFAAVWAQNCGGIIKVEHKAKILSSPGYPKLYGPLLTCNYTLVAPSLTSFINFKFLNFQVETTGTKCHYDNVTIYKRPDYAYDSTFVQSEKVGTYCGLNNPGKFRHRGVTTVIFKTDRWVERKGFQIEYKLDECGGEIIESTFIKSPAIEVSTGYVYMGTLYCTWNITAPEGKKIIIKFENFSMEHSDYCSFDYIELFNGSLIDDKLRLAKICGNLTNLIKPISIDNNKAVLRLKTDQTNTFIGFTASIVFKPKCDQNIVLTRNRPNFVLDKLNQYYNGSMECIFKVNSEALTNINMTFSKLFLSPCGNDQNVNITTCDCDYIEVLDGNGPFSDVIGRTCGYNVPLSIISTRSALFIRFVTNGVRPSTGFIVEFNMIESPCSLHPYMNFTGNETEVTYFVSPITPGGSTYPPNLRCLWIAEAPYGKIFEIQFIKFALQDSNSCVNDSLTIEDNSVKESIPEGLGEEIIYRGKSTSSHSPSFYTGITGPTAPHVYCGSGIPHDYISQTNKIKILFQTDSTQEFSGFNFTVKTLKSCSRNFTSLQGRILSPDNPENCKTTIKVPQNYTISLFFHRFFFYESDCTKSFLKIYDGDFDGGALYATYCGYETPSPIFSNTSQLSLVFHFNENAQHYARGNYDLMYVATDKGRGCGGEIYNYGGMFTSPLYPSSGDSKRSTYDCTWTVTVPQNLKAALRFTIFDMGSNLYCASDFVELLEINERGVSESVTKYCGEDEPAVFVSKTSKVRVHYVQTVNFPGTGWILNFMGVHEGAKPQSW